MTSSDRPESLRLFSRDLWWPPQEARNHACMVYALAKSIEDHNRDSQALSVPLSAWLVLGKMRHIRTGGAQVWVSKEVSSDLECSDITDPRFAEIPWPARSMEFVFEDSTIPSFHLYKATTAQLLDPYEADLSKALNVEPKIWNRDEELIHLASSYESDPTVGMSMTVSAPDLDAFASSGLWPREFKTRPGADPLNQQDSQAQRWMALMAYKVMFFASIPQFFPKKTDANPTRAQGGKPGVRNRPKTPRFLVTYLPKQRESAQKAHENDFKDGLGGHHRFLGRRGHLRTYRSARYVNAIGTRQFIAPIPGPNGEIPRRIFKVVKPHAPLSAIPDKILCPA